MGEGMSPENSFAASFAMTDAEKALCECADHATNVWVDGNRGHSPACPAHPRNLPHSLTHCVACDMPFREPLYDGDPFSEYACEGVCNV